MAVTKTRRVLIAAGTSNSAGSTTQGTELNLSTALGALINCRITNGASGPSTAASLVVYTGSQTGEEREFARLTSATGNNVVTDLVLEIPPSTMFVNVDVTGNLGQAVTCEVIAQELTSV